MLRLLYFCSSGIVASSGWQEFHAYPWSDHKAQVQSRRHLGVSHNIAASRESKREEESASARIDSLKSAAALLFSVGIQPGPRRFRNVRTIRTDLTSRRFAGDSERFHPGMRTGAQPILATATLERQESTPPLELERRRTLLGNALVPVDLKGTNTREVLRSWKQFISSQPMPVDANGIAKRTDALQVLEQMGAKLKGATAFAMVSQTDSKSKPIIQAISTVQCQSIALDKEGLLKDLVQRQFGYVPRNRANVVVIIGLLASPANGRSPRAGAALLEGIIRWARAQNKSVVLAPINEELTRYYASLGFRQVNLGMRGHLVDMVHAGDAPIEDKSHGLVLAKMKIQSGALTLLEILSDF